jgi:hypothetical protein
MEREAATMLLDYLRRVEQVAIRLAVQGYDPDEAWHQACTAVDKEIMEARRSHG